MDTVKEWQAFQDHTEDMRAIFTFKGWLSADGMVRRFIGPEFFEMFAEFGHDKSEYRECRCRQFVTEPDYRYLR